MYNKCILFKKFNKIIIIPFLLSFYTVYCNENVLLRAVLSQCSNTRVITFNYPTKTSTFIEFDWQFNFMYF